MYPPTKNQTDIGVENQTLDASDSEENKDMARQEFKDEADINYMLARFGINPPRGTPTYGEWDDTIDLQIALEATREAKAAFKTLPKDLREQFNNMEELITAVENGSLKIKEEEPANQPVTPPAVPLA